jgi:hypothetical protein
VLDEEAPHGDPLDDDTSHLETAPAAPVPAAAQDPAAAPQDPAAAAQDPTGAPPAVGQETAELDMAAVLEQDARLAAQHSASAGLTDAGHAAVEDELLEWETPDRLQEPPPQPLPGQESLSFE